jgi:ADP-heptose:LPS heptosyltransferase
MPVEERPARLPDPRIDGDSIAKPLKGLEKQGKRLATGFLGALASAPPMAGTSLDGVKSLLFLRYDRLGDMVISTGLFRLVREDHPGLAIHVLASPANAGIVRRDPNVDMVHVFDKRRPLQFPKLLRRLRRVRFDTVVNLVFYPSLTGALISRLCAPRRAVRVRVAVDGRLDRFYNVNHRRTIWGDARRSMLEETVSVYRLLGGNPEGRDISPAIHPGPAAEARASTLIPGSAGPRIGVNLAAGDPRREWSLDRWRETVELILRDMRGSEVWVFAPPGDTRGSLLAGMCPGLPVRVVEPSPDILQAAAALARMDLLITPDTAMLHLADALGIPLVAMYISREKSVLWKPGRAVFRGVTAEGGGMESIEPQAVAAAAVSLLGM